MLTLECQLVGSLVEVGVLVLCVDVVLLLSVFSPPPCQWSVPPLPGVLTLECQHVGLGGWGGWVLQ